jgi:hypothetical protein
MISRQLAAKENPATKIIVVQQCFTEKPEKTIIVV